LLIGVTFRFGASVSSLEQLRYLSLEPAAPTGGAPAADGGGLGFANCFDLLVDATGARCPLFEQLGFSQVTVLKSAQALGLVVHLKNGKTKQETQLHESNWAHQFHMAKFASLAEAGCKLQNCVYYRSTGAFSPEATHYFVMTAQADSLVSFGAFKRALPQATICGRDNLDLQKLEGFARTAIAEFVPELAAHELVPSSLQLFDFSERKQSSAAAAAFSPTVFGGAAGGGAVVVTRVGDALQEPFWPEGLGINRGFLHAFDCADLARGMADLTRARSGARLDKAAADALIARREALFNVTKQVGGSNRKTELKPERNKRREISYRIDPATRYVRMPQFYSGNV